MASRMNIVRRSVRLLRFVDVDVFGIDHFAFAALLALREPSLC